MKSVTKSFSFRYAGAMAAAMLSAYFVLWCYLGRYSFFLFLAAFFLVLFYIAGVIVSLVFWVSGRKKFKQAYIPTVVNISIALLIYLLPSVVYSKQYPKGGRSVNKPKGCGCNKDLYLEYYTIIGGGYMTTDLDAVYLTDKKNFRIFLGSYDEADENIEVNCLGDRITATKTTTRGINAYWAPEIARNRQVFTLTELRLKHIYD